LEDRVERGGSGVPQEECGGRKASQANIKERLKSP